MENSELTPSKQKVLDFVNRRGACRVEEVCSELDLSLEDALNILYTLYFDLRIERLNLDNETIYTTREP